MKQRILQAKSKWSTLSPETKETLRHSSVMGFLFLLIPLKILVHECGHYLAALWIGMYPTEFVSGLTSGYIRLDTTELLALNTAELFLVYIMGGIFETILILLLAIKFQKGIAIGVFISFSYCLWEAGKGVLIGIPLAIVSYSARISYWEFQDPLMNIASIVMLLVWFKMYWTRLNVKGSV